MDEKTSISFYLRANRIHVFKSSIRLIGMPKFIRFRVNYTENKLLIEPYFKRSFTSFRVPERQMNDTRGGMELSSMGFCRILARQLGWDIGQSYRIPGKIYEKERVIIFDLSKAAQIVNNN